MNITGIITEYNPFHLGHRYHLEKSKKDTFSDATICIMSGNFVQRGEPALLDKFNRAEIAVKNGVDLVIELPLIFSVSSAEFFASGACRILDKTSVVNNLYFGSEHGDIEDLLAIAKVLNNEDKNFNAILKKNLSLGLPFYKAREKTLYEIIPNIKEKDILNNSNNILAIEYIRALEQLDSKIIPVTLKRLGSNYNDVTINNNFASATSIRKNLYSSHNNISSIKDVIPAETYNHLDSLVKNNYDFVYPEDTFDFIKYKLLTEGYNLKNIFDVSEGLDNKILKELTSSSSLCELILNTKSKRYSYTRISRLLLHFFLGFENYNIEKLLKGTPDYIRPLAFNQTGCKILKEIKKKGNVRIITKVSKEYNNDYLAMDILGTRAYSILNKSISPYDDYIKSPKKI